MALTNAQKQSAHRQRVAEKIARYEAALGEIYVEAKDFRIADIAYAALNPER